MYKHRKASKGFTLVELLVVIAIIGVLATLVLLQLGTARGKARDTKRIADINQLRSAIELYFDDNSAMYPYALSTTNLGKYIAQPTIPNDPITNVAYFYVYDPSTNKAVKYHLYSELEQKNTSALNGDADMDSSAFGGGNTINAAAAAAEVCAAAYNAGQARDCIFDTGQK